MVYTLKIEGFGELHVSMAFASGRKWLRCRGFWPSRLQNHLNGLGELNKQYETVWMDAPAIPITNASDICFPSSSYLPTPKFRITGLRMIHTMVVCHGTSRSCSWVGQWTASPHLDASFLTLGVPGLHLSSPQVSLTTKFEACRDIQVISSRLSYDGDEQERRDESR